MSFVEHSIQTVLIRIITVLFVLIVTIINSRWLGPEGVGVVALLFLIKDFAFRFSNLGFGTAIAFFLAKREVSLHQILRLVWIVVGITTLFSGIILFLIWRRGFSPWNDIQPHMFYLAFPSIPMVFLRNYLNRILSGLLRITAINIADVIKNLSHIISLCVLVVLFELGVMGAVLSVLLSDLLAILYCIFYLKRVNNKANEVGQSVGSIMTLFHKLWRYGRWSYLMMYLGFFFEEVPIIFLKKFVGNFVDVGLFSRSRGLARQSQNVAAPVSQVLFPYTASSDQGKATWRTNVLSRNSVVVMFPIMLLMSICIRPIIHILYGDAFLPAATIFYAMAPGFALWPLASFLGIHVIASGKPRLVFFTGLLGTGISTVICWILILRYGAIGAGLSVSATYIIQTFLYILIYTRITGAPVLDVLLPRRADWSYYRHILTILSSIFTKKSNAS